MGARRRRQQTAAPNWEMKQLLYSYAEAGRLLSLRPEAVKKLVEGEELEILKIGPRQERITASSILSYLNRAQRGRAANRPKATRGKGLITAGSWRGK